MCVFSISYRLSSFCKETQISESHVVSVCRDNTDMSFSINIVPLQLLLKLLAPD